MSNMPSLNQQNLHLAPETVQIPAYDRSDVQVGIVHIGGGSNFFRSHLAVYIDDLLLQGKAKDFGICAVNMHCKDTVADLAAQDGLYTVQARDSNKRETRIIGSVIEARYLPDNFEDVLARMASPQTKIFSLTITQDGYCQDTHTGKLNVSNPNIIHDLENSTQPRTAIGLIVEALERRFRSGEKPVTILSCDNLPANGRLLQQMVTSFAALRDPALSEWIESNVSFPITTVDRIAPKTTPEFRQAVSEVTGMQDSRPVPTEPFREFVIENRFVNERPPFEAAGVSLTDGPPNEAAFVQLVQNAEPFWNRKFRMLNTGHTVVATLAQRTGDFEYIDQAVNDPSINRFLRHVMDKEIAPILPAEAQVNLDKYRDTTIARFANPVLGDRIDRVGAEGTRKIPKYVLSAIKEGLRNNTPIDGLCVVAAAWVHNLTQQDEKGRALDIRDPKAVTVAAMGSDLAVAALSYSAERTGDAFKKNGSFFDQELECSERFKDTFTEALRQVYLAPIRTVMDSVAEAPLPRRAGAPVINRAPTQAAKAEPVQ